MCVCEGESPSVPRKMRECWKECSYKNLFVHFYGFVRRFINLSAAERQKHTISGADSHTHSHTHTHTHT